MTTAATTSPTKANAPATAAEIIPPDAQQSNVTEMPGELTSAGQGFLSWLEGLDPTTLVWQLIVVMTIFYLGGSIKKLVTSLVAKIPQIKNFAGMEFDLSENIKQAISDKSEELDKEIEPYMVAIGDNPSLLFLHHFIDFERNLDRLYWEAFPNARDFMRQTPDKMIKELVQGEFISPVAMGAYFDIRRIRNEIVHGKHAFSNVEEARPYLKAVFLLRDLVNTGLEKLNSNKESKVD